MNCSPNQIPRYFIRVHARKVDFETMKASNTVRRSYLESAREHMNCLLWPNNEETAGSLEFLAKWKANNQFCSWLYSLARSLRLWPFVISEISAITYGTKEAKKVRVSNSPFMKIILNPRIITVWVMIQAWHNHEAINHPWRSTSLNFLLSRHLQHFTTRLSL